MSNPANPGLTKTCMNCGLQKPLSAFLEMSGTEGTSYGSICSTCRKTALEELERRRKTEAEGSSTTESGHKIDSKVKVQSVMDKREHIERTEEEYHADRKIDEEVTDSRQERRLQTETHEKKHRQDFLQKRTILGSKTQPNKNSAAQQLRTEMIRDNEKADVQTTQRQEERVKTDHDFTKAHQGEQITGQIKFSGQTFRQFIQYLGNAPIAKTSNQTKKEPGFKQTGALTQPTQPRTDPKKEKPAEKEVDSAVAFIKDNWRPGSKR